MDAVVCANGLLTCSVALHLYDTFGLLADLPGVKGPNSDSNFYRCPRHVCGSGPSSGMLILPFGLEKKKRFVD